MSDRKLIEWRVILLMLQNFLFDNSKSICFVLSNKIISHFVVRIIIEFYSQNNQNFVDSTNFLFFLWRSKIKSKIIFLGTVEGDCGIITWDGYDFLTGILGNRETCKWLWLNIIHDGPVTHAVRSKFLPDLIMTVGGKIFAVWQENFKRTFFWNKSNFRYKERKRKTETRIISVFE